MEVRGKDKNCRRKLFFIHYDPLGASEIQFQLRPAMLNNFGMAFPFEALLDKEA